MKKYNLKVLLLSLFLVGNIALAEVPEPNQPAPDPNYNVMMPSEDEEDPNKAMVGNDGLNQDKIDYGIGYEANVGKAYIKKVTDESGRTYYIDTRTDEEIINFQETNASDTYKESIDGIDGEDNSSEEKAEAVRAAKEIRKQELLDKEYTPKKFENLFLHNMEASGRGVSVVSETILNPENLESEVETHKDASTYYRDTFGYSQTDNSIETFKSNDNTAKLATAYEMVEEFEAQLRAKYSNKSISCYITRELIPKYYCPLIGRQDTLFAGDVQTSSGAGMKKCGDNCRDEKTCISYNVLSSDVIDLGDPTLTIYPDWNETNNYIKTNAIPDLMMVDTISFDVVVTPSENWEGTEEEFEEWLAINQPKFRYSVIKIEETLENPSTLLIDKEMFTVKSSLTRKTINISDTMEYLSLLFYKPYFTEDKFLASLRDGEKWDMIEKIEIKNLEGKYKSTDLYFCPFRQIVNSDAECKGEDAEVITLNSGSQVYNICTDNEHKIGPDRKYGGFYTQESCESNCVETADCMPTYSHYNSYNDEDIFKASVGCVDDENNTACTQEKCEELLADLELRPTNEWVTYNDDTKKQTITNNVIDNTIVRPKFNLGDELSTSTNYSELFQAEMKDHAYKYMIDNATFNRITYRLGEESPRKMSYLSEIVNNKEKLLLNLKPKSYDIDNGVTYNLYVILEHEQLYRPVAGVFMIDGNAIQANRDDIANPLQFIDKTYMIRTSASTDWWKTFKKVEFTKMKKLWSVLRCDDGTYEWNDYGYYDNRAINSGCTVFTKITYPDTPQLNINRNAFYQPASDTFATYDASAEQAEVFVSQEFSSDVVENTYVISDFLQLELENAPGAMIRDQESLNHDLRFRKIYKGDYNVQTVMRGWTYNFKVYAFYAQNNLSYQDIIDNYLIEENIFYEKANPSAYSTTIKHDGDLNNNIRPFILGNVNNTTVNMEVEPYLQEEGQRVFKFMFLYDDEEGTNPFEGYDIQGN